MVSPHHDSEEAMTDLTVLVLGCGDVGSAIAHRLFRSGVKVAVCDLPQPAHSRRGMAFTDAFFEGSAMLEGVVARHASDLRAMRSIWCEAREIPVVALPEFELFDAVGWHAAVDATMRKDREIPNRSRFVPLAIGVGPGFSPGLNCHVAIESQWGTDMGAVLRDRGTAAVTGGPKTLAGVGYERFVAAPSTGLWHTSAAIGQDVEANEIVGTIDAMPLHSPLKGSLRGLTHDGVMVSAGQRVLEVDPRSPPRIFGLGARPRAIARGVCQALGLE